MSLKTLCHRARGCSKSTARDRVRHQAKDNNQIGLTFGDLTQIEVGITKPLLMLHPFSLVRPLLILKRIDRARVVWSRTLIVVARRAVPLEVGDGNNRLVDWELLVVHTEAMTVGIGVREQTGLQDRVS